MIVTYNCDWTTPEEDFRDRSEIGLAPNGMSAIIGTAWRPLCPANDNQPAWLEVYG